MLTYKGMTCIYHEDNNMYHGVIVGLEIEVEGSTLDELESNFHRVADAHAVIDD